MRRPSVAEVKLRRHRLDPLGTDVSERGRVERAQLGAVVAAQERPPPVGAQGQLEPGPEKRPGWVPDGAARQQWAGRGRAIRQREMEPAIGVAELLADITGDDDLLPQLGAG